jgi:hypothetical protein
MRIRVTSPDTCVRLNLPGGFKFITTEDGVVEIPDSLRPQVARLLGKVMEEVVGFEPEPEPEPSAPEPEPSAPEPEVKETQVVDESPSPKLKRKGRR